MVWVVACNGYMKDCMQKLLDTLVAVLFCAGVVFYGVLIVIIFTGYGELVWLRVLARLQAIGWLWECLGVAMAFLLMAWVTVGSGIDSQLWKWLPPFCFFRKQPRAVRLAVVFLLVLGTLLGAFSRCLGFA
jgi:hypothetical protein